MANYSREEMEKQGNAEVGAGIGILGGLAALVIGGTIAKGNKEKRKQQIDARIRDIDKEIAGYKSEFLGGMRHSEEIDDLEAERKKLITERNQL